MLALKVQCNPAWYHCERKPLHSTFTRVGTIGTVLLTAIDTLLNVKVSQGCANGRKDDVFGVPIAS